MAPLATVIIATKNRKDDLRVALRSTVSQTVPLEVLVCDDGGTDGTAEMVSAEFPAVRLIREDRSAGYIVRRNQLAQLASSGVLISIDSDAAFSSPRVVEQTLREFDHPRVGAVAIPFVNVGQSPDVLQRAPDTSTIWVTDAYIGTAHALRRVVFLAIGGYREHLVHQGEEMDHCIRMLAAGYVVRLGRSEPIHHYESPRRDYRRMDYYGRRNDILFAWRNVPWISLPVHLPATVVNGARTGIRVGRYCHMAWGIIAGLAACMTQLGTRSPVPWSTYRLFRRLKKRGPLPLSDIEPLLCATEFEDYPLRPTEPLGQNVGQPL